MKTKRLPLVIVVLLVSVLAWADDSGSCGQNVTYKYVEATNTLTITGTGPMADYSYNTIPWRNYNKEIKKVVIESGVSTIGEDAFSDCTNLLSATIPNTITTIKKAAFYNCYELKSIIIPSSVVSIEANAFSRCSALESITIPKSLTSIGQRAFKFGMRSLSKIVVEEGNPVYDSRENCNAIIRTDNNELIVGSNTTIIPNSVTAIGDGAFCQRYLYSIDIPSSVITIGNDAFNNCVYLKSIIIPNSVVYIGDNAFSECGNMRRILIIGSGVTRIGNEAFKGTYSGHNNYCYATKVPETGTNLFCDDYEEIMGNTLYVPKASVNAYKAAEPWKYFDVVGFAYVDPIEGETTVNTGNLGGQDLTDNVVDDVYYNVGTGGYDATDGSIVIGESTNMAQIENPIPGTDGVKNNFTGLILKVAAGKGTIIVNAKTSGNAQLVVQVGNQTPMIATKTSQGDVVVSYDVAEDTYIYIYAIIGSSAARNLRAASTDEIRIYSIKVTPGATGIDTVHGSEFSLRECGGASTVHSYFMLDGRKLDGVPAKKGVYIVNGRKVVIK